MANPTTLKENPIVRYIKESRQELTKVVWPTRPETIRHTLLVIGVSVGVGIILGFSDFIFTKLLEWFLTLKQ